MSDRLDSGEKTPLIPLLRRFVEIQVVNIHIWKSIFQKLIMDFSRMYCAGSWGGNKPETQVVYNWFM